MKKSLLIVSHGSRREQSNIEVNELTKKIIPLTAGQFDIVHCAYLELAEPLIPDGIDLCINQGAESVLVLPYFLAAGRHVAEDIPEIINTARIKHPTKSINIATHLGAAEKMPGLLADIALNNKD